MVCAVSKPRSPASAWAKAPLRSLFAAAAVWAAGSTTAHAEIFQWDFGGGLTRYSAVSPFFPGDAAASAGASSFGFNAVLSGAFCISPPRHSTRFYLGLQHRFSSTSHGGGTAVLQSTYPVLRVQARDIFVTLGATPLNFGSANGSLTSFERIRPIGITYLAEGGYLYPITPEVGFGVALAARFGSSSAGFSAKPLLEAGALFRFYLGSGGGGSSGASRGGESRYDGWRYPSGWQRD